MERNICSWKGMGLLLCLFLGMMLFMRLTAAQVERLSGGQGIADLTFGISPSEVSASLSRLGDTAARFYRFGFLAVDLVYALAYCTFYRGALRFVTDKLGISAGKRRALTALPVIGMCADLLENTVLFTLLGMSERPALLCTAFTVFNIIKFVFVYSSLAALTGGLLCLAKKHLS